MRAPLVIGIDLKPFERGLNEIASQFKDVVAELREIKGLLVEIRNDARKQRVEVTLEGSAVRPFHYAGEN